MKWIWIVILFIGFGANAQTTDQQLAQHYFDSEEYDKAYEYYERLYELDRAKHYFNRLLICTEQTKEDKDVEKLLKKQISFFPGDQEYEIQLAKVLHWRTGTVCATRRRLNRSLSRRVP